MSLTSSRLRLISSLGVGVLVGTSLIVIIPEGIGAASAPSTTSHIHRSRSVLAARNPGLDIRIDDLIPSVPAARISLAKTTTKVHDARQDEGQEVGGVGEELPHDDEEYDHHLQPAAGDGEEEEEEGHNELPSFQIGLSMTLGFVLMFLIDRIPRHAAQRMQSSTPQMHHVSLDSLGIGGGGGGGGVIPGSSSTSSNGGASGRGSGDLEADHMDGLLGQVASSAQRGSRHMATTLGLVIHAAADGIAMGASATSPDTKMSFVIFTAIMIHKAPAAFGLTSLLLRQGLSKRASRSHLVVFSLAAPVGAIATWFLVTLAEAGSSVVEGDGGASTYWTGLLLLFSGGTFLYVAMHAMQEESGPGSHGHHHHHHDGPILNGDGYAERKPTGPQMRETLMTVMGMFLPLLTQIGHHHH
ncbi:solute carrier family 39 (zinc transporter), member 9 [Geosmithia morbida]|uniref:Solute carrier family 39 (Zinc transporter), member 9 n=1 Tax=Geosmithia morbida TaxID=1094350 RepID=A0A9P4YUV0_9HYPO|nr:solute carrier family 39 (zinc transporter), member 9 [Geosmithia morbida]KAF4123225.1 solute carrier family 39 (zinc transporter), member 9 [Geosmithia morbida]